MFDVIGKRRWFFAFSLALMIPGIIAILLGPLTGGKAGLQFAIDFTGGTVWSIRFEDAAVTPEQVEEAFAAQGVETTVTKDGDGYMEIRTKDTRLLPSVPAPTPTPTAAPSASPDASASPAASAEASPAASAAASPEPSPSEAPAAGGQLPTEGKLGEIRLALEDEFGPIAEQRSLSTVGAVVSQDLVLQALTLILFGAVGIVLWITFRFRDRRMGFTALATLLHDVIVVVGVFAILGTLFGTQIDGLFVTAMLTIIGFSVHDTIVVFDRIRENRSRHAGESFERIVNHSVLQTFGRSITTSLTVLITLLTLLLFAYQAIGVFVLALLVGIIIGTYSSIFNAAPLLVVWHNWDDKRRLEADRAARPRRSAAT